jgi:hypothetical protein
MCRDQNCVAATGAFWPKVPTFGCRGDMSPTCGQLSQPRPQASTTPKGKRLLRYLTQKIDDLLHPAPPCNEQRVTNEETTAQRKVEQRVIDNAPIITIPRITTLPPIGTLNNPTAKRVLQVTKRLHQRVTRNNTPSIVPLPALVIPIPP